jgi:hypothetical protein
VEVADDERHRHADDEQVEAVEEDPHRRQRPDPEMRSREPGAIEGAAKRVAPACHSGSLTCPDEVLLSAR